MTITVVLADDHTLFRQGLTSLLDKKPQWQIVGEANDGTEAVRLCEKCRPDIVILDVEMPGLSGIEAAERIREVSSDSKIVALSMYGDTFYQRRMFDAGAAAYVLKTEAVDDLLTAVEAVLAGKQFVSPSAGPSRGEAIAARSPELELQLLSGRELEVLRLLAEGRRTKEIAVMLEISAKTVETYRSRIMLKLGIDNLPGLVKFAIRAGIAPPGI
jgi:DNA-binding NarL/FixJ family response regulator